MLEKYFCAPKTLRRLRDGISGPHIDAFADRLERDGYAPASAVRYIRSAAHLGCFVQRRGGVLSDIDSDRIDSFDRHLSIRARTISHLKELWCSSTSEGVWDE